jgi:hypothetical protein
MGARIGVACAALFWATVFFGVIDLSVVPDNHLRFYDHYLLEILENGWGLLFTFLIPVPLLSWAPLLVRQTPRVALRHVRVPPHRWAQPAA